MTRHVSRVVDGDGARFKGGNPRLKIPMSLVGNCLHADASITAAALDRLIFQRDSFAKNTAASRQKSLSSSTRASSLLSVAISWPRDTHEPVKAFVLAVSVRVANGPESRHPRRCRGLSD
jgi:hypothetical protein